MSITDQLEEERHIINAAEDNWRWDGDEWNAFIAHARTALPLRNAQVEAVLSIHRPVEVEPSATICSGCSTRRGTFPDFRYFPVVEYPCPTVRAIEEAGA